MYHRRVQCHPARTTIESKPRGMLIHEIAHLAQRNSGKAPLLKTAMENSSFIAVENLPAPEQGCMVGNVIVPRAPGNLGMGPRVANKSTRTGIMAPRRRMCSRRSILPISMVDALTVNNTSGRPSTSSGAFSSRRRTPALSMVYVFINKMDPTRRRRRCTSS